jgi:hypothetical protein
LLDDLVLVRFGQLLEEVARHNVREDCGAEQAGRTRGHSQKAHNRTTRTARARTDDTHTHTHTTRGQQRWRGTEVVFAVFGLPELTAQGLDVLCRRAQEADGLPCGGEGER